MYHYAGNNPIRYSDPDGEFALNAAAAVIGALSGAAIGAVTTAIAGGSGRDIAAAALGGAASGALAGVTLGGSLVTQAIGATAMGAVSAVVGDVVTNAVSGNEITLEGVGKAALGGAVGGLVGFGAGKALSAVGNKIQSATSAKPTAASGKTYQTYTKTNPTTGEVYSGRTSGTGTPLENIARRDANHHMNAKGFGPAQLDKSSSNYNAIRGREQQLIDLNGGAKSMGGDIWK